MQPEENSEQHKQEIKTDSLYRYIRTTLHQVTENETECEKLKQRRINLQEMVENRSEVSKALVRAL